MKINQTVIKKEFSKARVQLSANTLDMINRELLMTVKRMAQRCVDGNVKRLTPELFYVALGKLNNDA